MRSCIYCKRRYKKNGEISFHRFPKNLEERKVWLQNMKITNWTPKTYDSVCSLHFADECFDKHFNRTTLKPGSIPTIFEAVSTIPSSPRLSKSTSSPHPSTSTSSPRPSTSTSSPRPSTSTSASNSASKGTISTKRKLFCDANITKLSDKTKKDQEQVTDHDYEVSSTPKKARIEFGLLHDHRYEITPRSSKKVAQQTRRSLKFSKAKLKALSQRVRRLKLKVANIKSVINDLIKKNKVSEECIQMLKQYDDFQMELFNRVLKNKGSKSLSHDKYPPQLRAFAITLHFYSAKAYSYVRNKFNLALPHPSRASMTTKTRYDIAIYRHLTVKI